MNLGVTMVFAIVAVILALSLKSKNPEYSTFISVAVCLVLLFICVSRMRVMLSGPDGQYLSGDPGQADRDRLYL